MLGVLLAEADEGFGASGAQVTGTGDDSPAGDAGIGKGDTITALGGRTVRSGDELRHALDRFHPDEKVRVTWVDSSGDTHRATVTLTEGPPA
jgi:S1-C subfamily serine protease